MYGIEKEVYKNLINYFQDNISIDKVILFGSRAKETENIKSDHGINLVSGEIIPTFKDARKNLG